MSGVKKAQTELHNATTNCLIADLRSVINFDALACECSLVGVDTSVRPGTPTDEEEFSISAECYQREHECRVVEEARFANPRLGELMRSIGLELNSLLCAPSASVEARAVGI